jgi:hypothetical protein
MSDIALRNVDRVDPGNSWRTRFCPGFTAAVAVLSLAACSGPAVTAAPHAPIAALGGNLQTEPEHPRLEVTQIPSLETLSTGALIARLGKPDFTRNDPPAEIWQYRGSTCVLDVFLYPEEGEMKVLHVATRDRDRVEAPENHCTPFGSTSTAAAS